MYRNNVSKLVTGAKRAASYTSGKIAAGSLLAFSALPAFAQDATLGAAAKAEVAGVKADVSAILLVLVGVVFLLVAWSYFKRAK